MSAKRRVRILDPESENRIEQAFAKFARDAFGINAVDVVVDDRRAEQAADPGEAPTPDREKD